MPVAPQPGVQTHLSVMQRSATGVPAPAMQPVETQMVFIVRGNVRLLEWAALSLFRAGHIPVMGEGFWPLVTSDLAPPDAEFDEFDDPVGERLLGRCDAGLRLAGAAPDADALRS